VAYTKQTWVDGSAGGTPISAARLGHIEDGIEDAAATADAAATEVATKQERLIVRTARITTGNVSPLPNTAGGWQALSGFTLSLPAAVGDWVELGLQAMRSDASNAFVDVAVKVGSSLVRYLGSGTSTPLVEGDPAWYPDPAAEYLSQSVARGFTVTADDLDGTNVVFVVAVKANGTGVFYASSDFPFYWCAKNFGSVA
jgi:hypothetical protein